MKASDSDRRIARALLDLPPGRRHAAFLDLADRVLPKTPAEQLVAWQRKQRRDHFISWVRTLSTAEMANVYARLEAGADPDVIRAEFPPDTPAPRGAGHPTKDPNDGNIRQTQGPKERPTRS